MHIVSLIFQMPQLKAESMSMVGLNLFQQLSHLTRIANSSFEEPLSEDQVGNTIYTYMYRDTTHAHVYYI